MKKIFVVLFLILTISIPVFAKQQIEDWIELMSAKNGTQWFYDLNSIKKSSNYPNSIIVTIKSYNNSTRQTNLYSDIVSCSWKGHLQKPYKSINPLRQVAEAFGGLKFEDFEQGTLSGALQNEFCDGYDLKKGYLNNTNNQENSDGRDWYNFMTTSDGVQWYYDVASLKKTHTNNHASIYTKTYNPRNNRTEYQGYLFFCKKGTYYVYEKEIKNIGWAAQSWASNDSVYENKPTEYLFNEFCKGE